MQGESFLKLIYETSINLPSFKNLQELNLTLPLEIISKRVASQVGRDPQYNPGGLMHESK